ncbi:putative 5'-Nucleotidase/apyrase [Candidatus Terasakiella magnetica]|uniref:Putative 5'-Nucleotidase/apyrase n=1 Tax=Candidatus Terasakiella magnetica TaxID=1867952 RepID=A0A1C3RJN2_9PROT|nr:thiosulfohydrolase SoxB [Candidatus Terasakiella magnetica]SCA57461.1 putative 5'-Nucleotidase/apyrase [Candidatus Terasakiella magnetica]
MLSRRDFLQVAAATAAMMPAAGSLGHAASAQKVTQEELLKFDTKGQVTLLNFTDIHAQIVPLYFREPSVNLGVGEVHGLVPHITGKKLLDHYGLMAGTANAYAFTSVDFAELSKQYGRVGGVAQMTTLVKAIREERPDNTLLIDCGDTWQGSYTSLKTDGEDMVDICNKMGVDAMTAHWEFTYGQERVQELVEKCNFPFLCGNVQDTEWEEDVFEHTAFFDKGGVKVALIGQAFPYTPVANPRYMMPEWSFGIRPQKLQKRIDAAKKEGAELIVVASHDGFDVDRKLAATVSGIDVLLTGHTHDAVPNVIKIGDTLMVASGSHGKFLARLDVKVENKKIVDHSFKLMPIFSDVIKPDPEMQELVDSIRGPHNDHINKVVGHSEGLLYRRGNFNGTFDDLICQSLLEGRDAEISMSPGFRWGSSLPPGGAITMDDIYNQTAITYPNAYRSKMTGKMIKDILEDVADNLFNVDPFYQQGGDMVRIGGMGYTIDIHKPMGSRISNMVHLKTGKPIEASKEYVVAGWASVNEGTEGPPIWDVVAGYVSNHKTVNIPENQNVKVIGA